MRAASIEREDDEKQIEQENTGKLDEPLEEIVKNKDNSIQLELQEDSFDAPPIVSGSVAPGTGKSNTGQEIKETGGCLGCCSSIACTPCQPTIHAQMKNQTSLKPAQGKKVNTYGDEEEGKIPEQAIFTI